MLRTLFGMVSVWGVLAIGVTAPTSAQYYNSYNQCTCTCAQPMLQPCYQTRPVTRLIKVKRTVQKPIYETEYEDREFTTYEPRVEKRTAEIQTVDYETRTEYRTVQRDYGQWVTNYRFRPQVTPCQYDGRPNFMGWWNRTTYSIRNSFTPKVTTQRQYVPNVVTQQVPVTVQVPRYGTREVTYNVTKMVPKRVTRRVPVQRVRYVMQEVEETQPVTVMETVQVGSRLAYGVSTFAPGTATALAPSPDSGVPQTVKKRRSTTRTAEHEDEFESTSPRPFKRQSDPNDAFESSEPRFDEDGGPTANRTGLERPKQWQTDRPTPADSEELGPETVVRRRGTIPAVVRTSRWTAHRPATPDRQPSAGPSLIQPEVSVADRSQ